MRRTSTLALLLLVLLTNCGTPEEKEHERLLREAFDAFREAGGALTLYEIGNPLDADYQTVLAASRMRVAGEYPVKKRHVVTKRRAAALIETLSSRKTYFPYGDGWMCVFKPHHVLEATGPKGAITAVICVECGDVQFLRDGKVFLFSSVEPPANAKLTKQLAALTR